MIAGNISYIFKYVQKHLKNLVVVFIALLSVSVSLLVIGTVFRKLIDNGVSPDRISEINKAIFFIGILVIIFAIGSFFRSYFINVITLKVVSELKADTYSELLKMDITRYENLKIGDIVSRLSSDIEIVGGLITNFLSFFVRNFIMLIGAIFLMFIQSTKLSFLVIISIPVLLFPMIKLSKHIRSIAKSVMNEQGNLAADINESFSGIRTVYAYNQQQYLAHKFNSKINTYIKHASIRLKLRSMFFALAITIIAGAIMVVIWIGSIDIVNDKMSSGQMVSFIYYAIIVGMSAGGIAELFSEIQSPLAALDRVIEIRNMGKLPPSTEKVPSMKLGNDFSIKFSNVSFSYPTRKDIVTIDNISLYIKQGSFVGIVGASGSGKSTLMQLLIKFYRYDKGKITIGGFDINNLEDNDIRSKIAYVEQNPTIFSGTIRSNITFSDPNANNEEVEKVAKLCGIVDFTQDLESGLDTEIGERGMMISGGQKQRIAIARALLYQPEILMLDEATSALDNESEKQILRNIKHYLSGKTIISIAHRISSIENADEIFVINRGTIDSYGTHFELLQNSENYNLLYKKEIE
jgi:ATP-binding cassette, subfamily B, bacterial